MPGKYRSDPIEYADEGYLHAIIKEGRLTGHWIEIDKKLYSPDELSALMKTSPLHPYRRDVKLKDPYKELARADRIIKRIQDKRNDFAIRIGDYFNAGTH